MFTKACLAVLASIALTSNGALALGHRHAQRHQHEDKRALVYESTETVTDTTWVTVTVDPDQEAATAVPSHAVAPHAAEAVATAHSSNVSPSPASSSILSTISSHSTVVSTSSATSVVAPATTSSTSVVVPTTSSAPSVTPTTLVTYKSPSSSPSSSSSSSAPSSTSSGSSFVPPNAAVIAPNSVSGGNKRGAAYNAANLISPLIGPGSHIDWAYNWGQVEDGLSSIDSSLEYVPMLWSTREDFISTWQSNAQAAISNGAKNFLSFNEPDNAGQANMDPATAAAAFNQHMNPFAGSVRLGSPAITNSNTEGEGVSWLKQWVNSCGGQCKHSFCAAHWYSPASSSDFLNFVTEVHEACEGKPVWITEFAPTGADEATISSFLQEVQQAMDNNAEYNFVERYAYFYVADGYLVNGNSPSSYGHTFAYGS